MRDRAEQLVSPWRSRSWTAASLRARSSAGALSERAVVLAGALGDEAAAETCAAAWLVGEARDRLRIVLCSMPDADVVRFAAAAVARVEPTGRPVVATHLGTAIELCASWLAAPSSIELAQVTEIHETLTTLAGDAEGRFHGTAESDPTTAAALLVAAAAYHVTDTLRNAMQHPVRPPNEVFDAPGYPASFAAQFAAMSAADLWSEERWQIDVLVGALLSPRSSS